MRSSWNRPHAMNRSVTRWATRRTSSGLSTSASTKAVAAVEGGNQVCHAPHSRCGQREAARARLGQRPQHAVHQTRPGVIGRKRGKAFGRETRRRLGVDRAGGVVREDRAAQHGFQPGDAPVRAAAVNEVAAAFLVVKEQTSAVGHEGVDVKILRPQARPSGRRRLNG